eukprot:scaffold99294_cov19-Tisochrysis_lutea.AAC.1
MDNHHEMFANMIGHNFLVIGCAFQSSGGLMLKHLFSPCDIVAASPAGDDLATLQGLYSSREAWQRKYQSECA